MAWFKRKPKWPIPETDLPFTRDTYDTACALLRDFITGEDFGPEDDSSCELLIKDYLRAGLLAFEVMLADTRPGEAEATYANDIATSLANCSIAAISNEPSIPVTWLARDVADLTSIEAGFARQDPKYAIHRAERVFLEALAATYLSLVDLETVSGDPRPGAEAAAQVTRIIAGHWLLWARPYAYAAFKGEELLP